MAAKKTLDKNRPYATISSIKPRKEVFEQDGLYFGGDGVEVGKVPGYAERQKAAEEAEKKKAAAKKSGAKAVAAEEILGDLGMDPNAEAARENAAAAAAEESAE